MCKFMQLRGAVGNVGYDYLRWFDGDRRRYFLFCAQPEERMVLNRNIGNFFAANGQLASCPGVIVLGIYYNDGKSIIFSCSDTQQHTLALYRRYAVHSVQKLSEADLVMLMVCIRNWRG